MCCYSIEFVDRSHLKYSKMPNNLQARAYNSIRGLSILGKVSGDLVLCGRFPQATNKNSGHLKALSFHGLANGIKTQTQWNTANCERWMVLLRTQLLRMLDVSTETFIVVWRPRYSTFDFYGWRWLRKFGICTYIYIFFFTYIYIYIFVSITFYYVPCHCVCRAFSASFACAFFWATA